MNRSAMIGVSFAWAMTAVLAMAESQSVLDFGAKGDGKAMDTAAIQQAIDTCSEQGGGTVYFAPGHAFLTGTIEIKSNVTLHLDGNARIVGSDHLKDYREVVGGCPYGEGIDRALVFAEGAVNIALIGTGTIDGGNRGVKNKPSECAKLLKENGEKSHNRSVAIRFRNCKRVHMRDLLFTNSRAWFTHLQFCSDVIITGITVDNPYQDGFNIESCQDVRISDCSLDCYDDGFALTTSHQDKPIRNVTIDNCTVKSHWSAIRFGPLSKGDFENVLFNNLVIHDSEGGGIKIDPCEGGAVRNCLFNNIRMDRVRGPICIQSARWPEIGVGGWNEKGRKLMPASPIHDLRFSNMIIHTMGGPNINPNHNPIIWIQGHIEAIVKNIYMDNIQITLLGGGTAEQAARRDMRDTHDIKWDEAGYWYTNKSAFGVPPSYGLYAHHVDGLYLRNVRFFLADEDARPALFLNKCNDCTVTGTRAAISPGASSLAVAKDCSRIVFDRIRSDGEVEALLQLENTVFVSVVHPAPFSGHLKNTISK
ncbi:glycosyl hydrolase family 28-related protein [Pontiellaceae bacterium B12227]|nr:glycosyl hydrolase family 28-related protein [Pontiellaceae bacterium B12227]